MRRCKTVIRHNVNWFVVGLAIRLAFMPFATHGDLIAQVWMTQFIAFFGKWNPYSFIEINYPTYVPIVVYPPVFMYFQAALLRLAGFILPDLTTFVKGIDPALPSLGTPYYLYPHIHELLIILKFPYLIFDISTGIVLSLALNNTNKSGLAFRFWMLNPIAIFTSFIFGQFDIVPTFFVALCVYFASRGKLMSAATSLGVGATFKIFPLMLLPIIVLGPGRSGTQRARLLLAGIIPLVIASLPFIRTKAFVQYVLFSEQSSRLLAATINVGHWDVFAIFISVYAAIVLHCMSYGKSTSTIWKWLFGVLLCFYSFALFHPQWFIWVAPLAGLAYAHDKKTLKYYLILILCFVVYTFYWGVALAGCLFAPVNPSFFINLPAPTDLIAIIIEPARFIQLFRSAFTGTALWWAFLTLKDERFHQ